MGCILFAGLPFGVGSKGKQQEHHPCWSPYFDTFEKIDFLFAGSQQANVERANPAFKKRTAMSNQSLEWLNSLLFGPCMFNLLFPVLNGRRNEPLFVG